MTKLTDCFMCQDSMFAGKSSQHPQKIAVLGVCTAIQNRDWQFFRGTTILVFQDHVIELHHLTSELQHSFMDDAGLMAAALEKTYPVTKLNHCFFGNTTPHLHWHIIVRRPTDPDPMSTIWVTDFPVVKQVDADFRKTAEEIHQYL